MKTQKPLAFLCPLLTACGVILASLSGSTTANAQFLPFWFGQGVVLEASDILDEGVASQSLKVTYYDQIDPSTLGDDEIWVVSPNGFNAFAKLESYKEIPGGGIAEDALFDSIGLVNPAGEPILPWLFGPSIEARYSLPAPDGSAWNAGDNGSYSVLVAPGSVAIEGGGSVEHQLLGTFGVRVGEPLPVQLTDWSINVVESRGGCDANVRLKFKSGTEVEWGEVMRDGERLFVRIEAKSSPKGSANQSHSYSLGDLPPGSYLFEVRVNDRLLEIKPFVKRNTPLKVPAKTEVAVLQGPAQPLTARVAVRFLEPGWMVTDPGEVVQRGNRFFVDAKARLATDIPEPEAWSMDYEIPQPEPGIYTFTFCLNGQVCDSARFEVAGPDHSIRVQSVDVAFTGAIACPDGLVGDEGLGDCFYDHVASVSVVLSPQTAVVNWGTPERIDDRSIVIDIETAVVPGGVPNPDANANGVINDSHRYDLGLLEQGRWVLTIVSNGKRLAREIFHSPASSGLKAKLRTEPLDPDVSTHQFHVIYSGRSGVNVETLGDDEIQVSNPIIQVLAFPGGEVPECLVQFAKLVSYETSAADGSSVDAIYSISCTDAEWEKWSGGNDFADGLDVFLVDGGVETQTGISVEGQKLGRIPFATPDLVIGDAKIAVRKEGGKVFANVGTELRSHTITDWGTPVLRGNTFFLDAGARLTDAGSQQEHTYQLLPRKDKPDEDPFPNPFPLPPVNEARFFEVVFRVNGQELTRTIFSLPHDGGILAKASIDIKSDDNGVVANVNVKFPGYPYHHIVDWGNVRREGNAFFLPAKAEPIDFIVDPGVVEQSHRYRLIGSGGGGGKTIPFEPLDLENWFALEARNLVIQTADEWAEAWGSLVPFDSLPPAPPVDLETHTLLAVLQGQKPNGCYAVNIVEVTQDANGVITVHYQSTVPGTDDACPEVITYPQSFVAVPKITGPVTFTEQLADPVPLVDGGFHVPPAFQYQVYFLINDVVHARSSFRWRPNFPRPEPEPTFDVAIDAKGGENSATVRVAVSTPEGVMDVVDWGRPVVNGHSITANVSVNFTPWTELPPEVDIAPQEPAEHSYELSNLAGGFKSFRLAVNGVPAGHAFFLVTGDDFKPLPFERWLAGLIGEIHDAGKHGLAEVLGDLDGDGIRDMEEFYLGTNPLKRDTPSIRPEWVRGRDGKSHLAICFQRRKDAAGVTAVVEASQNMHQWFDSPELFEQLSVTDLGNGLEEVVICVKQTASHSAFQFLRLRLHGGSAAAAGQ